MVDLRRLRLLRELAERGTVAATAAALHLTPSAVSQQLATLAREAGVPLLARAGRGVSLTPEARVLLDHAERIQAELERARANLEAHRDGEVGWVGIGAFATAISSLVAPALPELSRARPRVRVAVRETQAPECFTLLDAGGLDVAITVDWRDAPHRADARYTRVDLLADPLEVALPATHRLAGTPALRLALLAEEPWIAGTPGGPCVEVTLAACAGAGFNPDVRHRTDDWGAVIALVQAGAGIALVPRLALPVPPEGVVVRSLGPQGPARHIFAAVRAGSEGSPLLSPVLAALAGIAHRWSTKW